MLSLKDLRKADPAIQRFNSQILLSSINTALFSLFALINITNAIRHNNFLVINWIQIITAFLIISSFFALISQRHFFQCVAQERASALMGKYTIAAEQPGRASRALSLPFALTLNSSPLTIGLTFISTIACFVVFTYLGAIFNVFSFLIAFYIVISIFVLCIIILLVVLFRGRKHHAYQIHITDDGISSRFIGDENYIVWADAHIFACYRLQSSLPFLKPSSTLYELSGFTPRGQFVLVRWMWPDRVGPFLRSNPGMSQDEYDTSMERLHMVIAGRTGLPLLDFNVNS